MDFAKEKYKIIAIVIVLVACIASAGYYYSVYNISGDDSDKIEKAVKEYTGIENVQIIDTKRVGSQMCTLFKTDEEWYRGLVIFERGLNLKWRPVRSSEGTEFMLSMYYPDAGRYVVICGTDTNPEIASYEFTADLEPYSESAPKGEIVYQNTISNPDFMDVFERPNEEEKMLETGNRNYYYPTQHLFDSDGNDITLELIRNRPDIMQVGKGTATMEKELDTILAAAILIGGIVLGMMFWKSGDKRDEE
ncbi:hypothetical protein MmiAt1_07200 [Methanimicrococcus sp. At1]|uniref:Uncharacterized protein n=1 Tax=Methanimicrococcus hacksteinii TaxID=3028293 RepID=A0ABU3VP37_9EURY|nr:hypothetical protein [Methanimicrococcus sp. At1]MDV0445163.1 hypothetical protein [Methanimicrococcus sp. At1]